MYLVVLQKLTDRIRFVVSGAILLLTINTACVFGDIVDRPNLCIIYIMVGRIMMDKSIEDICYREFERKKYVWSLFGTGNLPPGFQVTGVQRNKILSVFGNMSTTRDSLSVAESTRLNHIFALWYSCKLSPLEIHAQGAALVAARLGKQALDVTKV